MPSEGWQARDMLTNKAEQVKYPSLFPTEISIYSLNLQLNLSAK